MTLDSRERFSATVDHYGRHRPGYPGALFDWLESELPPGGGVTADVGCGTGISSRQLAARGYAVIGIDPNPDMLAEARRHGGASYLCGEAAATGLAPASVDLVTAAQAYHWFDIPASLAEFRRVLRPGGACAAFWNLRGGGALMDEYDAILRAHATEYGVLAKPRQTLAALRSRVELAGIREAAFDNAQRLDRQGLFGRAESSSFVAHGLRDRPGFERSLGELFDRHAVAGEIVFRYRCQAILWRFAAPG